jgi:chromosome partitioning protein
MGKIITINIQKGGCGKTTTAHELASNLTLMGKKCLAIDLDPQQNLSRCSGAELTGYCTVYELLRGDCTADDSIQHTKNYDIIPSNKKLKYAEREFIDMGSFYYLKKAIEPVKEVYDFIIIDTPPNLGILPSMALTAADYAIVPVEASASSIQGLGQLQEMIEQVKEYRYNPDIKVLGILLTRFSERTIFNRVIREQLEKISENMGTSIFKIYIRSSIVVNESQGYKQSLVEYAPTSNPSIDYRVLAKEVLEKMGC